MKLGFIGTGNITVAVVNGICGSKIAFKKILSLIKINYLVSSPYARQQSTMSGGEI